MKTAFKYASIIFLVVLIYSAVLFVLIKDPSQRGTFGDMYGGINAIFSGLALAGVLYTLNLQVQANKLQRNDSKFNQMPLLVIEPTEHTIGFLLNITNVGRGPAINLELIPIVLSENTPIIYKAVMPLFIGSEQTKTVRVVPYFPDGKIADDYWTANLKKGYATQEIFATIDYEDVAFNKLQQTFSLGKGDTKVKMVKNR